MYIHHWLPVCGWDVTTCPLPTPAALTSFWHHEQPGPDWIQSRQLLALYLVHSWDMAGEIDRLDKGPASTLATLNGELEAKVDEALGKKVQVKASELPQQDSKQNSRESQTPPPVT